MFLRSNISFGKYNSKTKSSRFPEMYRYLLTFCTIFWPSMTSQAFYATRFTMHTWFWLLKPPRYWYWYSLLLQGKTEILRSMKETSYLLTLFFVLCIWDFQEHSEQRPPEGTLWFPAADFSLFCFWAFLSIKLSLVKATNKVK